MTTERYPFTAVYLAECQRQAHCYQQNLLDQTAIAHLRQYRQQLAESWLRGIDSLEHDYLGELGQAHQILLNSGIRQEPLIAAEQRFLDDLLSLIPQTEIPQTEIPKTDVAETLPALLAAMLFCRADRLPFLSGFDRLPRWFWDGYLSFRLESPRFFREVGDVEQYCRYMQQWVGVLHQGIFSNPESEFWQHAALHFTQYARFIPLYFSTANLKQVYIQRAEIMEFALMLQGYELDFVFPRAANQKIRLGILNAHFSSHTETFSTLPAFEYLDRDQFEIILYAVTATDDRLEQYCKSRSDRFVALPDTLSQQVQMIREDDLDVLLLGANTTAVATASCLLALHRLARVQMTLYSSPVTTGMRSVDYYISGILTEPPAAAQSHYREQLITLKGTGFCLNYVFESAPGSPDLTREKVGLPAEAIVFVSGANFHKIIPELRETWTKILAAVPNAVLMLYPFSPSWSSSYAKSALVNSFQQIFAEHGVELDRLLLLDCIPHAEVKSYLRLGDVYLDSFPYTGSLSTADSLEVELPTVVMAGATLRSRQGAALLRDLEMADLIVTNEADYVKLAIALGSNPSLQEQKRQGIQQKMRRNPGFFDSRRYSAQIGSVLQEKWAKYQQTSLEQDFRLSRRNLIVFPDWSQTEKLEWELVNLFRAVLTHADRHEITLLLDASATDATSADEAIANVVLHLFTEEEIEMSDTGPEVVLLDQLAASEWSMLLPRLQSRIRLQHENQEAIALAQATALPQGEIEQI